MAITRHGSTIGFYLPAKPQPTHADREALRRASEKVQEMLDAAGVTEGELIQ